MRADHRARLLRCPLFRDLADAEEALGDLARVAEPHAARAGERLIEEGSEADTAYIIESGRVRVEKQTLYADTYTVTVLDGEQSSFFGEMALLERERRSASVVAETDCEFLTVRRDGFLAWGDRHPAAGLTVMRRIAEHLAERLRCANRDIGTLYSAVVEEMEERL